jgi:N-succinyldiaminopimelate aminotransferase
MAKQFLTFAVGTPLQHAAAVAIDGGDAWATALAADLRAKRDRLCAALEAAGLEVHRPAGTYFANADIAAVSDEDGRSFCRALPERAGVVAIPTAAFYDDAEAGRTLVRFAFCKREEVIDEAARRLRSLAG